MPTVPGSQGPRVALGGDPDVRLQTPDVAIPDARLPAPQVSAPAFRTPHFEAPRMRGVTADPNAIQRVEISDRGASQYVQAGENLGNLGTTLARAAMQVQAKVNATVADDALNDAREAARKLTWGDLDGNGQMVGGYTNLKGYDAIKRPSGKGLDDEVAGEFDKSVKAIAKAKLTNADQRVAFDTQVADMAARLRQGASVYAAQQFDQYHTGVYKAQVQNLSQDFALLDPGDRAGQQQQMQKIEGAVATLVAHNGGSAQELEVGMRAARGAAVASMFDRLVVDKKYTTAQALINEYGGKIDADTVTKMKASLDGRVGITMGEEIAHDVWQSWAAPSYTASDAERAHNVVLQTEARGTPRQVDDNGKLVRSPKGAGGIGQLMPETAKAVAKKIGRPELADMAFQPTKQGEAANRLLSQVHFNDLVGEYRGDLDKAWAAYNAGDGWLKGGTWDGVKHKGALKEAAESGKDWREFIPKETQDYISYARKAYDAGNGKPAKPSRQELLDKVDARISDPDMRKAAYSWLDRRFSAAEADERQGYEQSYLEGLRIVRESGGNINAVSPELRNRIRSDQFDTIQTYAKNITDGGYISTDPAAYYVAMAAVMDPRTTINTIEAMRPKLSEQDFKAVQGAFMDRHAPQPGKGPDSLDVSTLDEIVDTRLQYLGVNIKPDKSHASYADDVARLGAIRQFTHQYVLDKQRATGQKFTDYKQLQDTVNALFTRNQDFKTTVMGVTTSRGSQNVMTTQAKDIPADTRAKLTDQLQKGLKRKPTEAEVLQAYFRSQFYAGASSGR